MELCNSKEIRSLLERHGFRFSKSMGQNFLIESWVPKEIAAASGAGQEHCVLEIGPGIGPLTEQLAKRARQVVAVELDRSLLPVLDETMAPYSNVSIVPGDIMKISIPQFVAERFSGLTPIACANLPYNITTPVLTSLIDSHCFSSITVMIQREVALRICALPGSADYGAFSVFCQYYTQPEFLFEVSPSCFLPAPKVTSAVIRLLPRPASPAHVKDEVMFFRVVRAAFAQRRKTLLNGLTSAFSSQYSKDELRAMIQCCGFPEDIRGERLGISEFAVLSNQFMK